MKLLTIIPSVALFIISCSCTSAKTATSSNSTTSTTDQAVSQAVKPLASEPLAAMAKAVAFKMSGPYAANVPITLKADGSILSYPAPTDISAESSPLPLGDGWWLDRRGVSPASVFTSYTWGDYAALPSAPSAKELLAAVIPGAKVTEVVLLPMTPSQAAANIPAAIAALKAARK